MKGGTFGVIRQLSKDFWAPFGDIEKFANKGLTKPKKGRESLVVTRNWKGGPFCLEMVLYFKLEALDKFKIKY